MKKETLEWLKSQVLEVGHWRLPDEPTKDLEKYWGDDYEKDESYPNSEKDWEDTMEILSDWICIKEWEAEEDPEWELAMRLRHEYLNKQKKKGKR